MEVSVVHASTGSEDQLSCRGVGEVILSDSIADQKLLAHKFHMYYYNIVLYLYYYDNNSYIQFR